MLESIDNHIRCRCCIRVPVDSLFPLRGRRAVELQVMVVTNDVRFKGTEVVKGFVYGVKDFNIFGKEFHSGACPYLCIYLSLVDGGLEVPYKVAV